ncbi:RagB/SusD family nutrient uptake outer membrane protein [Muricauda ruestringensis]|uniref:RagB/SusD family nutrient uptake outer membrane protein n=1 Tax=Flagellimonas aurea TaxID=2915619 RepID=A0ABS3G2C5_9FLAO|nr:RagB/SusD family nutrient uptake outer membrane protein [Allomuricauda aurea]MBO0353535.1 RagB/SusD family nutrient uptake outer membrane protein [Allomuricauda aurea]
MKSYKDIKSIIAITLVLCALSCDDFVEVDVPTNKLTVESVFDSDETARSAMQGIYNELFRSASFCNGGSNSVTALAGLSADEIFTLNTATDLGYLEFQENEILPNNTANLSLWSSAYNIVYMANSVLEGVSASEQISVEVSNQLEGEVRFIRAFTFFQLVNLYGEVPLVLTTDYRINAEMSRASVEEVYSQISIDLQEAVTLLDAGYPDSERINVNRFAAEALLARVYLYRQEWALAEIHSTNVINQSGYYELLKDLDQVFLKNSQEAIWQISPAGNGNSSTNTNDGYLFVSPIPRLALTNEYAAFFEDSDMRRSYWIGYNQDKETYYPHKYKDGRSTNNITEYSTVLRLAEQYLIRAEARARQGNISGGISDVDKIKDRAGLGLLSETNPEINQEDLVNEILIERKKELFTEWGHRWFDLKRVGKASETLGSTNPLWQDTDVLYPIPEQERMKIPGLGQNDGY